MTVRIQKISVQTLGPLASLQADLGQVNLIYGHNETGKTYLVEFLLSSLFQHAKNWDLRGPSGTGSVQVLGLGPEAVAFSPDSGPKLESHWDRNGQGLPLNLARFLVVKGGELALSASSQGGVGRDVLKLALTSQALLDAIWDGIPATVRAAEVVDGLIEGRNQGVLKNRTELQDEIEGLRVLLEQIDGNYSQGPAWEIEEKIQRVQRDLELQQQAKRHLAYQTHLQLDELQTRREALSKADLQETRDRLGDLHSLEREQRRLEAKQKGLASRSRDYRWLESAIQIWEEKGLDQKNAPPAWLGIAGLSAVGAGLACLILGGFYPLPELRWLGSGLGLAGLGLSLYSALRHQKWTSEIEDSRERASIQEKYETRFQEKLSGLADLKAQLNGLVESHLAAQTVRSQLSDLTQQRVLAHQALENLFRAVSGESVPQPDWNQKLAELRESSRALDEEIQETTIRLGKLDLDQELYLEDPPPAAFDPEEIRRLEGELEALQGELRVYQSGLDSLKAQACGRIGAEISKPWREVLDQLRTTLLKKEKQHQEMTAQIAAQIGLTQVLSRLREEEDHKINLAINAKAVSDLLRQITGRYQKLELGADQLMVYDEYRGYPLAELSTGAREQVQLALRLGLASELCGGDPLFLILDDAFQHSDWERRQALVGSALGLAKSGWQILYLTMDDHIRDLFQKQVKPALKSAYQMIDLN